MDYSSMSKEELIRELTALAGKMQERKETLFKSIHEAPDAIFVTDEKGNYVEVNPVGCALLGFDRAELLQKNLSEIVNKEDVEQNPLRLDEIRAGKTVIVERRLKKKDGTYIFAEIRARSITENRLQAIVRDISETKKLTEELKKSEDRFRKLSETAFEAMFIHENGIISEANNACCTMFGCNREELIGKNVLEFTADQSKETVINQIKTGNEKLVHAFGKRKNGTIFPCEVIGRNIYYGSTPARIVSIRDISGQIETEKMQKNNEERYRSLMEGIPGGIVVYSREKIFYVNEEAFRMLGMTGKSLEDFPSPSIFDFILPEYHATVNERLAGLLEGTDFPFMEIKLETHDKRIIDVETKSKLIELDGHPAIHTIFHEITDRKKTEQQLRQSEERFRMLAENALDVVYRYALTPKPHYEYVSPSTQTVTGYTPEEFYKDPYLGFKITHPDDAHVAGDSEKILRESGTARKVSNGTLVMRWIRKDGKIIWTETRNKPIFNEQGKIIAIEGISRDITETKKTEEELRQSEEKFRLLSLSAPIGIFLTDIKGTPYYANKKLGDITGLPYERIVNHNWLRLVHPDDSQRVSERILRSIEKGLDFNDEFRVRNFALGTRWVKFNATSIRSANENKTIGWVGTVEDVTEQRENELRVRESERALPTLMNNLPGMAYRCDYDDKWTMRFVSQGCYELTGYRPEDLKHNYKVSFSDIVLPEDG